MTHPRVWHEFFHVCDIILSCVRHYSFVSTCVAWLIRLRGVTSSHVWPDTFESSLYFIFRYICQRLKVCAHGRMRLCVCVWVPPAPSHPPAPTHRIRSTLRVHVCVYRISQISYLANLISTSMCVYFQKIREEICVETSSRKSFFVYSRMPCRHVSPLVCIWFFSSLLICINICVCASVRVDCVCVSVCVCVFVYTYVHIHIYVYTICICVYVYNIINIYICIYIYTYTYIHMYIRVGMHASKNAFLRRWTKFYVRAHTHTYTNTHIHKHTHTHTHTHAHRRKCISGRSCPEVKVCNDPCNTVSFDEIVSTMTILTIP